MTSVVGLSGLLSDISTVGNYKKAQNLDCSSRSATTDTTGSSSTATNNEKGKGKNDTPPLRRMKSTGEKKGCNPPMRRSKSTGDRQRASTGTGGGDTDADIAVDASSKGTKNDNEHGKVAGNNEPELNSSVAFYDVFDYSLSNVVLSDGPLHVHPKTNKGGEKKSHTSKGKGAKLESVDEDNDTAKDSSVNSKKSEPPKDRKNNNEETGQATNKKESDFNDTLTSTYDVFDFSISTMAPDIVAEEASRRSSRRTSMGGTGAAAAARTGRFSKEAQKAARERISRANSQHKQQQQRQRPGLVRSNSIGSTRDLVNTKMVPEAEAKGTQPGKTLRNNSNGMNPMKSPLGSSSQRRRSAGRRGTMSNRQRPTLVRSNSIGSVRDLTRPQQQTDRNNSTEMENCSKNSDAMKSPLSSSSSHHRRSVRGPRSGRRQSLAHVNAASKQMVEQAVELKDEQQDQNARTVQKWTELSKEFSAATSSLETTVRRAHPSIKVKLITSQGAETEVSAASTVAEQDEPNKGKKQDTSSLQTLSQEMATLRSKGNLSVFKGIKNKLKLTQSK